MSVPMTPVATATTELIPMTGAGIAPGGSLQITTGLLANAQAGIHFQTSLAATGGAPPYLWSLASGTLPSGLLLDAASGSLSGTTSQGGQFDFSVQVSDASSPKPQTAMKALTLAVLAFALQINSGALPNGQVGVPFQASVSGTGGVTPYTWSISSGALPSGLTLNSSNGAISGTSALSGSSTFNVTVTDSTTPTAQTSTASFTITMTSGIHHSVSMTWATSPSSAASGYNLYRSNISGSGYALINSTPVSGLAYTDAMVVNGQTYYYVLTAVDPGGDESVFSNEIQEDIP
jgi:hypothetical protein